MRRLGAVWAVLGVQTDSNLLLEKIERFLHVMPALLKAHRLFHTLYVTNSSFPQTIGFAQCWPSISRTIHMI